MATKQSYSWPSSSNVTISGIGNPTGQPVPPNAVYVAGEDPSGDLHGLQTDATGRLLVSLSDQPLSPLVTRDQADGTPGAAAPTTAIQVAGSDGTDLRVLNTDNTGKLNLNNISGTVSLPTGASTAALQTTGNASLASIDTNTTNLVMTETAPGTPASFALTVQGNASGVPIPISISGSTGDASINIDKYGGTSTTLGLKAAAASIPVVIASDQVVPVNGTISISQGTPGTTNGVVVNSSVLPTGAATASNQATEIASLATIATNTTGASTAANQATEIASLATIATNTGSAPIAAKGRSIANAPVVNLYSSTPVTSASYVQLIASTTSTTNLLELFDSSGVALYLAVGAAASEVVQLVIYPGGNGQVPLAIPAGSRVSVKATSTSAISGFLVLNLYT